MYKQLSKLVKSNLRYRNSDTVTGDAKKHFGYYWRKKESTVIL